MFTLLFFFSSGSMGWADPPSNLEEKEIKLNKPVMVTSRKMTWSHTSQTMLFEGEVKVVKGDMVLTSDRVKITYRSSDPGSEKEKNRGVSDKNQDISLIEAEGSVRVLTGNREVRSERAEYRQKEEILVLTGSPVGWDKHYRIAGNKITIYLKEDRSEVEGGQVLFTP